MSIIQSETPGTIFRLCLPVLAAKTVGDSYRGRVVDVDHEVNVRALRQRRATGQLNGYKSNCRAILSSRISSAHMVKKFPYILTRYCV